MRHLLYALALIVLTGSVPLAAKEKGPRMKDLADTINTNPILTNFAKMVQASDLGTFLSSRGPFTVFVPTDSAFAVLPPGMLEVLLQPQNKERLQDIVLYHIINGKKLGVLELTPLKTLIPCQGPPLLIRTSHTGALFIMKAKVSHADIRCANGVINEIDSLLMPPDEVLPPISAAPPPPPPAPTTNATDNGANAPAPATNAAPADTNNIPVAPIAKPEDAR